MMAEIIFRAFMIVVGLYLITITILSLAKRIMTEQFCLVWAFMSGVMILIGVLLRPSQITRYISGWGLFLFLVAVGGVLWGFWLISIQVSVLIRKNQELAMQTSLLNQDSEQMIQRINELERKLEIYEERKNADEESTVRN